MERTTDLFSHKPCNSRRSHVPHKLRFQHIFSNAVELELQSFLLHLPLVSVALGVEARRPTESGAARREDADVRVGDFGYHHRREDGAGRNAALVRCELAEFAGACRADDEGIDVAARLVEAVTTYGMRSRKTHGHVKIQMTYFFVKITTQQ